MTTRLLHKMRVKVLTWLGLAIDIHSKGKWPGYALSNFYPHGFDFEGVHCGSMEGFLQSLKTDDIQRQRFVCSLSKQEAKMCSTDTWKKEQNVFWNGRIYNRQSKQFQALLRLAYKAMLNQCPKFREALEGTGSIRIYHTIGKSDTHDTILTEKEFCGILTELRNEKEAT